MRSRLVWLLSPVPESSLHHTQEEEKATSKGAKGTRKHHGDSILNDIQKSANTSIRSYYSVVLFSHSEYQKYAHRLFIYN
jgi:hypothetical protein